MDCSVIAPRSSSLNTLESIPFGHSGTPATMMRKRPSFIKVLTQKVFKDGPHITKKEVMQMGIAPLNGSFMITSIIGLIISFNVFANYPSWGFAFMIVFTLMFVASLISMTYAPIDAYDLKKEKIE